MYLITFYSIVERFCGAQFNNSICGHFDAHAVSIDDKQNEAEAEGWACSCNGDRCNNAVERGLSTDTMVAALCALTYSIITNNY